MDWREVLTFEHAQTNFSSRNRRAFPPGRWPGVIWKNEAVSKLKQYKAKKLSLENIPLEIQQQMLSMSSIRSADPDSVPVRGNATREDVLLNKMTYRAELIESYTQTKLWVDAMDRALGALTQEEFLLLDRFFIHPEPKAADRLAGDLHMDVKTVYRRKDDALKKFTVALYGVTET